MEAQRASGGRSFSATLNCIRQWALQGIRKGATYSGRRYAFDADGMCGRFSVAVQARSCPTFQWLSGRKPCGSRHRIVAPPVRGGSFLLASALRRGIIGVP